jgi:hypothetical protein
LKAAHLQNSLSLNRDTGHETQGLALIFIELALMQGQHLLSNLCCTISDDGCSIWLKQCAIPFRHAHHQAGENPELRTLFYWLARLYHLPVSVIVVFDGDLGLPVKHGVQVVRQHHWLEAPFQQIVKAFKFTCHTVGART